MIFHNDEFWNDVITIILKLESPAKVIGPKELSIENKLFVISDEFYEGCLDEISFLVIHKDLVDNYDLDLLDRILNKLKPIYANEVFVVYSKNYPICSYDMKHVKPLVNKLINRVSKANKYINQVSTRTPVYLGNNRAITKTVYGHKIIVDTRDLSLSPHILLDGEWESWITKVFLNYVQPGMNVLDIGSNVGYYSLLAAERIGENGSLICFEANPEMSDILFHNLLLNGFSERSKVVTKAVYSHADKLEFKIYDKFKGSSSLWANDKHAANFRDKIKVYEVDAVALDEFLPKNTKIDLIKIDAEGAEPYILKGAKKLITSNPNLKIIMEFAPTVINVSYGSVSNFYQEINDLGMKIYKIMHDSTLELMNLEECENIPGIDVVLKK